MAELSIAHTFFDPSGEWVKAKNAYEAKQGSRTSSLLSTTSYPRTTWAQVAAFNAAWQDYIDPVKCYSRLPPGYYSGDECTPTTSPSYNRALALFSSSMPRAKLSGSALAAKIASNEEYPYNDQFWIYGWRYAIELSSSVNLPDKFDYAGEAFREAINSAPETIRNALSLLDPSRLLPKLPFSLNDMVLWSIVGLGAYGVYWMWKKERA